MLVRRAARSLGTYLLARVLFAAAGSKRSEEPCPADARVLTLRARDGACVRALEIGQGDRGTVVYFHGNGETAIDVVPLARLVADEGYRVVALEYRGYGMSASSGPPTETGLYADAAALVEHVVRRDDSTGNVALWGTSLGTGVAVEMARRYPAASLALVSPFTSIGDVARYHVPLLPTTIVQDRFDSASKAREVELPTLIVHGERDRVVPATMGRALANALPRARFVGFATAGHGIFFSHGDAIVREVLGHVAANAPSRRA